jgi:DMSO/TMAO reductase YedYZ heme-binding membrane subunit
VNVTEAELKQRTRRRFFFTGLHLCLYFSFSLNWTVWGNFLAERLGASHITGSLLMFISLILIFIALESVFLWLSRQGERS